MSAFRYVYYRTDDKCAHFLRGCCKRRAAPDPDPEADLRGRLAEHFYAVLLRTPFGSIDQEGRGSFNMDDFARAFGRVASPPELASVFRLINQDRSGTVTPSEWQAFHQRYDPEYRRGVPRHTRRRDGCPDFLEYGTLLDGILTSCSRFPLREKLAEANEPFPPSEQWLTTAMEAEWATPLLRPHWGYARNPVPDLSEERQVPDWTGGFTVRDEGHVGMTSEDFCRTEEAVEAGLTMPEVVGLRLYTGPGYEALNLSLRANSQRFPVTQYCIDSAIGKLAQVGPLLSLLRGMRKPMDPRWVRLYNLYRGLGRKRLALSDPGFVSATTDLAVATGQDFGGPLLFALHTMAPAVLPRAGFLSNGGDVQWVSQYPAEAEVLLPSNVILVPRLLCKHMRDHGLPVPADKSVFQFLVFFPWDFAHNCPLVTTDFLACANALLDHLHGLDVATVQACRVGHPGGVPNLSLSRPPYPSVAPQQPDPDCTDPRDAASRRPPSPATSPTKGASVQQINHEPKPRNPSMFIPSADPSQCIFIAPDLPSLPDPRRIPYSDLSTVPDPIRLLRHLRPTHFPHLSASGTDPTLPGDHPHVAVAIPPPQRVTEAGDLSRPHPSLSPSTFHDAIDEVTDDSVSLSFSDLSSDSYFLQPVHPVPTPPDALQGSDVLRLGRVPHYTPAEVEQAVAALQRQPRYSDGLDEVGLVGHAFPRVPALLHPFPGSPWDVGWWGLIAAGVGAAVGSVGLSVPAAAGIAAAVAATTVVASAVPLTTLRSADPVRTTTITPTVTPTQTNPHSQTTTLSFTATQTTSSTHTRTASPSPTKPRTISVTPTRSVTPSPSATRSPTLSASSTRTVSQTWTSSRTWIPVTSVSPVGSPFPSDSPSPSANASPSPPASPIPFPSPPTSLSLSLSPSGIPAAPSVSPVGSPFPSDSPSPSADASPSPPASPIPAAPSVSPVGSPFPSDSQSPSADASSSPPASPIPFPSPPMSLSLSLGPSGIPAAPSTRPVGSTFPSDSPDPGSSADPSDSPLPSPSLGPSESPAAPSQTPTPTSTTTPLRTMTQAPASRVDAAQLALGAGGFNLTVALNHSLASGDFVRLSFPFDVFSSLTALSLAATSATPFGCSVSPALDLLAAVFLNLLGPSCLLPAGAVVTFNCTATIPLANSSAVLGFTVATKQDALPYAGLL